MKYLQRKFSVPACGPEVTQEEWDNIFKPKDRACPQCGNTEITARTDKHNYCWKCSLWFLRKAPK